MEPFIGLFSVARTWIFATGKIGSCLKCRELKFNPRKFFNRFFQRFLLFGKAKAKYVIVGIGVVKY